MGGGDMQWCNDVCGGGAVAGALDDVLIEAPQDGLAVEGGRGLMGGQSYKWQIFRGEATAAGLDHLRLVQA